MLVSFSASNFLSFDTLQVVSLKAGKARKYNDRVRKLKYSKVLKCKTIFGPNASGKSNLITALKFMQITIKRRLLGIVYKDYFRLKPENENLPSIFSVTLILDNKLYEYCFSVILSMLSIVSEALYELNDYHGDKKVIFVRDVKKGAYELGDYFKDKDGRLKLQSYCDDGAEDDKHLLLNTLNRGKEKMYRDYPSLKLLNDIFLFFDKKLEIRMAPDMLYGHPWSFISDLEWVKGTLNRLGLCITDIKKEQIPFETFKDQLPERAQKELIKHIQILAETRSKNKLDGVKNSISIGTYKKFYEIKLDDDGSPMVETLKFCHENASVRFDGSEESDGTIRLLDLLDILYNKDDDKTYVIDEIDRCLHPGLTRKVISLFLELAAGRNCQLIATTHEDYLLGNNLLRNDEIDFLTKDFLGATVVHTLEKQKLRSDKSIYAALMEDGSTEFMPKFRE